MSKPYFQEIDVECWRQTGLRRREWSVCLRQLQPERAVGPFLLALNELVSEGPGARRALTFKPCDRRRAITKARLSLHAPTPELRVMCVTCNGDAMSLELTPAGLESLRDGLNGWIGGAEDFCVAPEHGVRNWKALGPRDRESLDIWFWGPTQEP
jgi:hypothetical protein